jgi:UNC-6/NTR/C345C module
MMVGSRQASMVLPAPGVPTKGIVTRMTRPIVSIVFLATLSLPFTATPASACSCVVTTPEEQAEGARVVFTGRVRGVEQADNELSVRFRVKTVYKGHVERHTDVVTASDSAACGCSFKEGKRYTVFGSRRGEPVPTNLCSGTKRGSIDPDEYGLPDGRRP